MAEPYVDQGIAEAPVGCPCSSTDAALMVYIPPVVGLGGPGFALRPGDHPVRSPAGRRRWCPRPLPLSGRRAGGRRRCARRSRCCRRRWPPTTRPTSRRCPLRRRSVRRWWELDGLAGRRTCRRRWLLAPSRPWSGTGARRRTPPPRRLAWSSPEMLGLRPTAGESPGMPAAGLPLVVVAASRGLGGRLGGRRWCGSVVGGVVTDGGARTTVSSRWCRRRRAGR